MNTGRLEILASLWHQKMSHDHDAVLEALKDHLLLGDFSCTANAFYVAVWSTLCRKF